MRSGLLLAVAVAACTAAPPPVPAPPPASSWPRVPPSAEAPPPPAPRSAAALCEIHAVPARGGVRVEGIFTGRGMEGEYALAVRTAGIAGTSETVQEGPLPPEGGALGAADVNGSHYKATLSVRDRRGEEVCRAEHEG